MRRVGHVSVRELAILSVMLAVIAAVVAGVSIHRGTITRARRGGIVSLSPALTELLFELGAGDQVTGISDYTRLPEGVARPVVGDAMRVNRELILWLQPRVILIQQRRTDVLKRLEEDDKIAVEKIPVETLADLREALRRLDDIAGSHGSERAIERINAELDAVRRRVAGRNRPTVLLVISRDPAMAVGSGTYLDELIEVAGGVNVVSHSKYVPLNDEQISQRAPQVIIDVAAELSGAKPALVAARRESWRRLTDVPAVEFGRVHVLTDPSLTIPGSHVGRAAEVFARSIHPDALAVRPTTGPARSQDD